VVVNLGVWLGTAPIDEGAAVVLQLMAVALLCSSNLDDFFSAGKITAATFGR
jgi:hypothetical protein